MIGQTTLRQSIGTVLAIAVGAVALLLLSALFGDAQAHASGKKDKYDNDKHYSYRNHKDDDHDKKNRGRKDYKRVKHDNDRCDRDNKYSSHYKWVDNKWKWDDDCDCDCDDNHKVRISYSSWNSYDWDDDCDDDHDYKDGRGGRYQYAH